MLYYQSHYYIPGLANIPQLRNYYLQNRALETTDPVGNTLNSTSDKENVYAGYGQYTFGFGPFGFIAGVRLEETQATYSAYKQDLSPGSTCTTYCPVSTRRNYLNVFPTGQLRYEVHPDLIARAAISSTVARPGFEQVAATTTINSNGDETTGNPALKPTTATGFDLSIEQYLDHGGIASFGLFAKEIHDYIVTNAVPLGGQVSGGNLGTARLFSFTNGRPAQVYGLELNLVKKFRTELPGWLGGLGVGANWTQVASHFDLPVADANGLTTRTRNSILPSTSRTTANAEVTYDYAGLHLTVGGYYTSPNIFTIGPSAATDQWTQQRLSVDFGAQYQVLQPLSVYFNLKNLTNTPLKFTEGEADNRVIQREFYGVTLQAGVNIHF